MNSKNIAKHLKWKLNDWIKHIEDEKVVRVIQENAIITGGALVSLLNNEPPNDYDIYFKTLESCEIVANYYANKWNELNKDKPQVEIRVNEDNNRVECFISSDGVAMEEDENGIDDLTEPKSDENPLDENVEQKPKYRPRYFSTNAISLSDKIQIVIRFWGEVETIHENYDFVHCTCSYDFKENKVNLPNKALECIINKELVYQGSKYPLCSIIRTRKFISRGWSINAGQYVKMAMQLNDLNLKDLQIFKEQLTGVDSLYFSKMIESLSKRKEKDDNFEFDTQYIIEIINKIF